MSTSLQGDRPTHEPPRAPTPPRLLYICQDGVKSSGVASYGYQVLRHVPGARMLLLNADAARSPVPGDIASQVTTLPEATSHRPEAVVASLERLVTVTRRRHVILPNTGDTPWAGVLEFLARTPQQARDGIRVLGFVHSDTETQYGLAERYGAIAPHWVGVSRRCADRLSARGVPAVCLPYPIPMSTQARVDSSEGPLRVAYVGRIEEEQKRVSRLVDLFLGLAALDVEFLAAIVGEGRASGAVRAAVASSSTAVRDRVLVHGPIAPDAIPEFWRHQDVCLLVSEYEGLPLALLEAMAEGVCPVVMAVSSGLPELLRDGYNARVVPQGDVPGMASALADLAARRDELRRLGRSARETVRSRHDAATHFAALRDLCDGLWRLPPPEPWRVAPDPTAAAVRRLTAAAGARPIAVYGAGMFGRKVVDACLAEGLLVHALFDSDTARANSSYRGLMCRSPADVVSFPEVTFIVGSLHYAAEIENRIREEFASAGLPTPPIVSDTP